MGTPRHGRPVACLTPPARASNRAAAEAVMDHLRQLAAWLGVDGADWPSVNLLRDEGRR